MGRANGTRVENDVSGAFIFPFASNIKVDSKTTYGSITSVTYNWIPKRRLRHGIHSRDLGPKRHAGRYHEAAGKPHREQQPITVPAKHADAQGARAVRSWAARALALAVLPVLSAGCNSGGGVQAGTAFAQDFPTSIGAKAIRPGFEIGLLYYDFENTSSSTVVITSVGIAGPGIGTAVRPVQVMMAPLRVGWHRYEANSTGLALYTTDPPVFFEGGHCRRQALVPLKGFRMTPGSDARFWVVLRAIRPGKWLIPRHVIYYTAGGVRYRQDEPLRAYGLVADNAAYIPPYYAMAQCVRAEGTSFLPGYHAGRVSG